jgi:hypothetical protein
VLQDRDMCVAVIMGRSEHQVLQDRDYYENYKVE